MEIDVSLEEILDSLEQKRFLATNEPLMRKMFKKLHFSEKELGSVMLIFLHLKKYDEAKGLTTETFIEILHKCFDITDAFFHGRIISALEKMTGTPNSVSKSSLVTLEVWCYCLSLFTRGTLEEKIKYCYTVYENGKKILDTVDMFGLLQNTMVGQHDEERDDLVRDLVLSVIVRKMDKDRDGRVSFEDYRATVHENPNMLECFGPCLPQRYNVLAFLATFTDQEKVRKKTYSKRA